MFRYHGFIKKERKVLSMQKIHERIMQANYAKRLKKLIILIVCVTVLGGGISAGLLVPQIREAAARRWEQDRENRYENDDSDSGKRDDEDGRDNSSEKRDDEERQRDGREGRDHEEYDFFDHMAITGQTTVALVTAGITGLISSILLFLIWLSIAAWLYQAAVQSGMNGLLWLAAGLAGNIFADILFLIVRSFIRVRCPSCGSYQQIKTQYCAKCGTALHETCASCGASCAMGDTFCNACGKELHKKEQ